MYEPFAGQIVHSKSHLLRVTQKKLGDIGGEGSEEIVEGRGK